MDISVIIPIYNVEEFLVDCLESVRRNVIDLDAEVLLIDDGSTDNSSIIAKLYAEKLDSFFYYRTENGGLSRARNYGVSLAKGKYIFFVDSDDLLVEGILKKMLETAERNGTELTVCNVARIRDRKIIGSGLHFRAFQGLGETVSHITKYPNLVYDATSWNKLILRSFYDKFNISFPEGYVYEDNLPNFMMHYHCNGVSVLRDTGYLWRQRIGVNKQITQDKDKKSLTDKIEMLVRTLAYARECSVAPEIMETLETKFLALDFDEWLNILYTLPENTAMEYVKPIKDFVAACINREYIKRIPLIKQQIYQDIMQDDFAHLLKVVNYKNSNYTRAPIVKKDGKLEMVLPVHIFTIKSRDAAHEFGNNKLPDCAVDSVTATGDCVSLLGHLYEKRVSIPFDGTDYFKALLLNGQTGYVIPLKVCSVRRQDITGAQGSVLNYDDYSYCQYDYDGAGFRIDIDFEELVRYQELQGVNYIIITFDFKFCSGNWLLKNISGNTKKRAEKFFYTNGKYTGRIAFDVQNIIQVVLDSKQNESLHNPGTDILRKIPPAFSSTTAGKQLVKLQDDNRKLKKEKEKILKEKKTVQKELSSIKSSKGFNVLSKCYHFRDSIKKSFNVFSSDREAALEKGIPPVKRITTSDRRVTLINYWTSDPAICNQDWLYRFVKNNTDINHLNIFSIFGKKEYVEKYATKKDVFFSGENLDVKHGLYDEYCDYCLDYVGLSLGFAQRKEANYLRLPLWMVWVFDPVIDKDRIAERVHFINQARNTGKYECSVIARHDKWNMRTPIYEALKDKVNILCAGKWKNNTNILWDEYGDNKISFLNDCKFTICAENEDTPYYVTEKLFEAFLGGSIPIYAGAGSKPEPDIVNLDAVLLWERGNKDNNDAVIRKVCDLNRDEKKYAEFLSQTKLLPYTVDYVYNRFVLLKEKILELN